MRIKHSMAALAACAALAAGSYLAAPAAASPPPLPRGLAVQTFSASASAGLAAVNTASEKSIRPVAMVLRASSAGVVTFKSGSNSGTTLLNVYLAQDTTVQITPDMFGGESLGGPPLGTSSGECLFIADLSATVTGWVLYTTQ